MGSKRYEKYSDPLTSLQKKALKEKEKKPEGEKRHLQIISYSDQKLVDVLSNESYSTFDKSIAKEEILRRLCKYKKRYDNRQKKIKNKQPQLKKSITKINTKTGLHIGADYENKLKEFLDNNGNITDCPFD